MLDLRIVGIASIAVQGSALLMRVVTGRFATNARTYQHSSLRGLPVVLGTSSQLGRCVS